MLEIDSGDKLLRNGTIGHHLLATFWHLLTPHSSSIHFLTDNYYIGNPPAFKPGCFKNSCQNSCFCYMCDGKREPLDRDLLCWYRFLKNNKTNNGTKTWGRRVLHLMEYIEHSHCSENSFIYILYSSNISVLVSRRLKTHMTF